MDIALTNLKALLVVLAVATTVFMIARPICLRFMAVDDFARRRNAWVALTLTAFTSPSFWLFVLVAVPLLAWCTRKDTNPVALYLLMMQVVPPGVGLQIPAVGGINQIFELTPYRILSFAVLIPAALRLLQRTGKTEGGGFTAMDLLILAYAALTLAVIVPYESMTNTVRRGFLYFIDVLLLYYVVSRSCTSRRAIVDAMASLCLASAIFAPLALFESLKGWLLYYEISSGWGKSRELAQYLFRAGTLRAEVSAGHSLALGYILAIAFGFWLYLSSRVQSKPLTIKGVIWIWGGLLAAYARAPWLVAAVFFFVYIGLGPNGAVRFLRAGLASAVAAGLVLVSPLGERIIANLPFVGTVDTYNVDYRKRVAVRSWEMILQNPLLGDPNFVLKLEDLRQGQGIVDLMNQYAVIGMSSGLVGLFLFLLPIFVGIWSAYRLVRRSAGLDPDMSLLGANMIACMLATLFMLATGNFGGGQFFFTLLGLLAGYAQLGQAQETAQTRRPYADRSDVPKPR